ncbi:MAG: choice-of-anchor A family protein, partial [Lentisphaerae bacterium]|nr:choice-of-anchor A family protein [Lentisphaerota bacterium]
MNRIRNSRSIAAPRRRLALSVGACLGLVLPVTLLCGDPPAGDPGAQEAAGWQALATNFNALVFGDFTASGGATEARLAVGGAATFTGGYSVGIPVYGLPVPVHTNAETDILITGGDLYDGAFAVNGNIIHGGMRDGPYRWMPDGNVAARVTNITFDASGNVAPDGTGLTWLHLWESAACASAWMAGLPDTGVSALDFSSPWQRLLVGTNTALNVFNVSAADWSMSSAQTVISVPAGAAVLVNVHGGPVTITYASIELLGADCRRTVFNYADAGQVTTTGFLHPGSVLAPYASASLSGGGVHGSALFGGNVATSLGFAFHNFPYCGQELPGPGQQDDSDGDGLPDTWELLFFGGFGRDGSGDFDGDGFTDAEEFAAGTDPADPASFPAPQTVSLEVRSAHGHCMPPAGAQTYPMGATAACRVTLSPVTEGASRYVCTGWSGAGSVPPAGSNLEFAVTLQTDSAVTWLWATNHWLGIQADGCGTVSGAVPGWHPAGSTFSLTAAATNEFWKFAGWSGDTQGLDTSSNPLAVMMDRPRNLTARFSCLLPPDPATVAPPPPRNVVTLLADSTRFLYEGENPIQTGVDTQALDRVRAAVLRGRALDKNGAPLPGVTVTVNARPEFGQTLTRLDGCFDMVVNGGGPLHVNFSKNGFLHVQRLADVPWQNFTVLPDVTLITADPQVTAVDFTAPEMQVARGSAVEDAHGARRAMVMFPTGVVAAVVTPSGATQQVDTLSVRLTEYTVGDNGPSAMPGDLPPTVAYTYCVDISADEVPQRADGKSVLFDRPVFFYVDNFLGMPTGIQVPMAYYDAEAGMWVPTPDGRVVEIVDIAGDLAVLDTDTEPGADNTAGVTEDERRNLAALYGIGKSLWRVPITHFTPYDCNYGVVRDEEAKPPNQPLPEGEPNVTEPGTKDGYGSVDIENRIFRETAEIAETPFRLHYSSDRMPGDMANYTLRIPVSGETVPDPLESITLEVQVAGQSFQTNFPPLPNLNYSFVWDGFDVYGRRVEGLLNAMVRIHYNYQGYYALPPDMASSFGFAGGRPVPGDIPARASDARLSQTSNKQIGGFSPFAGCSGWTLNAHHIYDPASKTLTWGTGFRQADEPRWNSITTAAGGDDPSTYEDGGQATETYFCTGPIALGPDGSLYVWDYNFDSIRRVDRDGVVTTIAVLAGQVDWVESMALAPDGSFYIADTYNHRILRLSPDGSLTIVAGNGIGVHAWYDNWPPAGDGGPATEASLDFPYAVTVDRDGALFIADSCNFCVRRVAPDGIIQTVIGNGYAETYGDGGPASEAAIDVPMALAAGPDGSIYCALGDSIIRKVGPDGIISTVAGTGVDGFSGDGGPATNATLNFWAGAALAVGPDGAIYIADTSNDRVRRISPDGIISTVAGNGTGGFSGDGGPATAAMLNSPGSIAVGPDGAVYVTDCYNNRVRRVAPSMPGLDMGECLIPSEDGVLAYHFDATGRHLRTLDAATDDPVFTFAYTPDGDLASITDRDGLVTAIERDAEDRPLAITGPYGHRTVLSHDANGWLSAVTNPEGETLRFACTPDGLLTNVTSRRGFDFSFDYGPDGRIVSAHDPCGGSDTLDALLYTNGLTVTSTDALGRSEVRSVEYLSDGSTRRTVTDPAGLATVSLETSDRVETVTRPDGSTVTSMKAPDPRFGMAAPYVASAETVTQNGLTFWTEHARAALLTNRDDPLSATNLTETTTVNGRSWQTVRDIPSRTVETITPLGRRTRAALDEKGRPVMAEAPGILPVTNVYNALGQLVLTRQGDRETAFAYGPDGTLRAVNNALGETLLTFADGVGRVTNQVLADASTVSFAYDRSSYPVTVTLPHGAEHAFGYNPLGLTERYTAPAAAAAPTDTLWTYNAARQPVALLKPDGTVISNAYDAAGRLSSVTASRDGEADTVTCAYDGAGRLAAVTRDGRAVSSGYDAFLKTGETTPGGDVAWTYDNDFRVTGLTLNGAPCATYAYDDDGALTRAGDVTLTHDPTAGFLTDTTLGNVTDARTFNGFGEVSGYAATLSDTPLYSAAYNRDALGRLATQTETIGGATVEKAYAYDTRGRLVSVTTGGVVTEWYAYDLNGNRTNSMAGAATYDAQDRLLASGTATFTHDANGNRVSKLLLPPSSLQTSYAYDLFGQLKSVTLPDGRVVSYDRDALNRVTAKRANGAIIKGWIYKDGLKPVAETDAAGS